MANKDNFDFDEDITDTIPNPDGFTDSSTDSFIAKTVNQLKETGKESLNRDSFFDFAKEAALGTNEGSAVNSAIGTIETSESIKSIKRILNIASKKGLKSKGTLGVVSRFINENTATESTNRPIGPSPEQLLRQREQRDKENTNSLLDRIFSNGEADRLTAAAISEKDNQTRDRIGIKALTMSAGIHDKLTLIHDFQTNIQSKTYRASLELSHKQVFLQSELLKTTLKYHKSAIAHLADVVKNTGMSDLEKRLTLSSFSAAVTESALSGTGITSKFNALLGGLEDKLANTNPRGNLGKTLFGLGSSRAQDAASNKLGGILGSTGILEGISNFGTTFSDFQNDIRDKVNAIDDEKGNKITRFLKKNFKSLGLSGLDFLKEDISEASVTPNNLQLLDDPRTTTTVNVVIPKLLSKILSASTGSPEIAYDHKTSQFSTVKDINTSTTKGFGEGATSGLGSFSDLSTLIEGNANLSPDAKEALRRSLKTAATRDILGGDSSNNISSIDKLRKSGLFDHLPSDVRSEILGTLEKRSQESTLKEDLSIRAGLSNTRISPNQVSRSVQKVIQERGIDYAVSSGLVSFRDGRYQINEEKARSSILDTLHKGNAPRGAYSRANDDINRNARRNKDSTGKEIVPHESDLKKRRFRDKVAGVGKRALLGNERVRQSLSNRLALNNPSVSGDSGISSILGEANANRNLPGISREESRANKQAASLDAAFSKNQGDEGMSITDKVMSIVLPITTGIAAAGSIGNLVVNAIGLGVKGIAGLIGLAKSGLGGKIVGLLSKFMPRSLKGRLGSMGSVFSLASSVVSGGVFSKLGLLDDAKDMLSLDGPEREKKKKTKNNTKGNKGKVKNTTKGTNKGSNKISGKKGLLKKGLGKAGGLLSRALPFASRVLGAAALGTSAAVAGAGLTGYQLGTTAQDILVPDDVSLGSWIYDKVHGNSIDLNAPVKRDFKEPSSFATAPTPSNLSRTITPMMIAEVMEGTDTPGDTPKMQQIMNLRPAVLRNLYGMAVDYFRATGRKLVINTAARSASDQARLIKKYGKNAAPVGSSMHEFGLAIDTPVNVNAYLEKEGLLKKWGFWRPLSWEGWHIEPVGVGSNVRKAKNDAAWADKQTIASIGKGGGGPFVRGQGGRVRDTRTPGIRLGSGRETVGFDVNETLNNVRRAVPGPPVVATASSTRSVVVPPPPPLDDIAAQLEITGATTKIPLAQQAPVSSVNSINASPVAIDLSKTESFLAQSLETERAMLKRLDAIYEVMVGFTEVPSDANTVASTPQTEFNTIPPDQHGIT